MQQVHLRQAPALRLIRSRPDLHILPLFRNSSEADFIRKTCLKKCAAALDAWDASKLLNMLLDNRLEFFTACSNLRFDHTLNEVRFIHRRTGIRIATITFS